MIANLFRATALSRFNFSYIDRKAAPQQTLHTRIPEAALG